MKLGEQSSCFKKLVEIQLLLSRDLCFFFSPSFLTNLKHTKVMFTVKQTVNA